MPAATTLALASAGMGLVGGVAGIIGGASQKRKAQNTLDHLQVPELNNPYKDMPISTMGSDLMREEGQRTTANTIDALQGGGARNMLSAIPQLVALNNQINENARKEIDDQMMKRNYAIADYEVERNRLDEQRYQNELAGLGEMYSQGQQMMWNGLSTSIASVGNIASTIGSMGGEKGGGTNYFKDGYKSTGGIGYTFGQTLK